MKTYFDSDTYDTPNDTPRYSMDKLFPNSRWFFYWLYTRTVFRSRSYAVRNIYDNALWAESSFWIFRDIERCGGRFHLRGLDNLRKPEGPIVIISNHMGTLETQIFPCIIAPFRPVTFIVKESLIRNPVFGPIMRSRDPIVVGRRNARKDMETVLRKGSETIEAGRSIIVFPQSTRKAQFDPQGFNSLGIKLARKTKAAVVPAAIKTDFWGNARLLKELGPIDRKKPIHMTFGEPITVHGNGKKEHSDVVEFIASHIKRWEEEA